MTADQFDDFWRSSDLGPATAGRFAERLGAFTPSTDQPDPWARTATAHQLSAPPSRSPLTRLLQRRCSERDLGRAAVTGRDLGALLGAIVRHEGGYGHPSAGDLRPVRASVILWRADHPLQGRVAQHDPALHTLTDVGQAPSWEHEREALGGLDASGSPALAVLLFGDPTPVSDKYGERGGRFLLLEAGAALQSLSLAAAELRLPAYLTGGAHDQRMRAVAGHARTNALCVAVLLVGGRRSRWPR